MSNSRYKNKIKARQEFGYTKDSKRCVNCIHRTDGPLPPGSLEWCEALEFRMTTPEGSCKKWSGHGALTTHSPQESHNRSQLLVLARLLEKCLEVIRNVEAEGSDEGEMLQALIEQGEAAVKAVLLEGLASNNNNADHGHG